MVIIFWNFTRFYHSPKVKRKLICAMKNFVYELSHELLNDLILKILGN